MPADLDAQTQKFVHQLHNAWSSNASAEHYSQFRDDLLAEYEQAGTRLTTLKAVVAIACPSIIEINRHFDAKWNRVFTLAESIEADGEEEDGCALGKRKRSYNDATRMRNLAVVASLWSPNIVWQYRWNTVAQGHMRLLRACAVKFPRFKEDFCMRLNHVLLDRHCEALQSGRKKTLNDAWLQPHSDLDMTKLEVVVADNKRQEMWISNEDGALPIGPGGMLLKDCRPQHFQLYLLQKDSNGLLVARDKDWRYTAQVETAANSQYKSAAVPSNGSGIFEGALTPFRAGDCGIDSEIELALSEQDLTISPLALFKDSLAISIGTPEADSSCCHDQETIATNTSFRISCFDYPTPQQGMDDWAGSTVNHEVQSRDGSLAHMESRDHSVEASIRTDADRSDNSIVHRYGEESPGQGKRQKQPTTRDIQQRDISIDSHHDAFRRSTVSLLRPANTTQPLESDVDACLQLSAPPIDDEHELTVEEELHNKYHKALKSYMRILSDETQTTSDRDQRHIRAQWLTPDTRWARVWSDGCCDLSPGSAGSERDADVLYYSSRNFVADSQDGKIFRKPIVIKEAFSDLNMHTVHGFASLIEDTSSVGGLDVRGLDEKHPVTIDPKKFASLLRSQSDSMDGLNALNLRSITKAHRPLFAMLKRFRLLESLTERLDGNIGKRAESSPTDIASCIGFNIVALAGAFSGAHVDALGGTWVRNLNGLKFWMIVPEHEMESEWEAFANAGDEWTPDGKQRLILLEENDVLFMPPGSRIVHAVHSPTKCLMEGGILWDEATILSTLEAVHWICQHQNATNEPIAHQLPLIIAGLERLVRDQPERFRGDIPRNEFKTRFRNTVDAFKRLGCKCGLAGCTDGCPCVKESRRCTAWCSEHPSLSRLNCMEEV